MAAAPPRRLLLSVARRAVQSGWPTASLTATTTTKRWLSVSSSLRQQHQPQRAIVTEFGEDVEEGIQNVKVVDMDKPDPAQLTSKDVIVAVRSAGISWVDLVMSSGQYQHVPQLPFVPGLEYSGIVSWAGQDVSNVAVGDKVYVDCFSAGPRTSGAYQSYGGCASYAVAPSFATRHIPSGLSFDQAANFAGNYETAYYCLITRGQVKAGDTVLIHGASGATGLAAVQIAKLLGATVIATGGSDEKLAKVAAFGADHVVNCAVPEDDPSQASVPGSRIRRFRDDVKALTGGRGVDVVYDGVGGDISMETLRCLQFGARYLVVGWASTPNVGGSKGRRGAPAANTLPTNLMLMKGLNVLGAPAVIGTQQDPSIRPPRLAQLTEWVESGALVPHVSHTFDLAQIQDALAARWGRQVTGGCAVRPPPCD